MIKTTVVPIVCSILILPALVTADSLAPEHTGMTRAVAVMHPTAGHEVRGIVTFTKTADGVRVQASIKGLTPGKHGFHIHQYGDCSAADGTSAGGHFNPHGADHGGPSADSRHAGDLGNLDANESGDANYDRVDHHLSLVGHDSIIGRAVIIHAHADDLTSQPTGGAGPRVACGAIGSAKE